MPPDLAHAVAIAATARGSLALRTNGTVIEWGEHAKLPAGLSNAVAVSARTATSMAVGADGKVVVSGGHAPAPPSLSNVIAVATGGDFASVALRADGTVATWGFNTYGRQEVPAGLDSVVAVAAGHRHFLALTGEGRVVAWGGNEYGQTEVPLDLQGVIGIAASSYGSLALGADGSVTVWGDGAVPLPEGADGVVAIAAYGANLALIGDGPPTLRAPTFDRPVPIGGRIGLRAEAVGAAPLTHQWQFEGADLPSATGALLQLTNVQPTQAGQYAVRVRNAFGESRGDIATLRVLPIWIARHPADQSVRVGSSATLSVEVRGAEPIAYQWYFDDAPLVGGSGRTLSLTNLQVEQGGRYRVAVTNAHGAAQSETALLDVVSVVAWGVYDTRLLSNPATVPPNLGEVVAVEGGRDYSLALRADGRVVSWSSRESFGLVPGLDDVVGLGAGWSQNLAVRSDGTVTPWESAASGQTNVPPGITDVVAVAAGLSHAVALRSDGSVVAWGDNSAGQTNVPPQLTQALAVAAGERHNLALTPEGQVIAWGDGGAGQTNVPAGLANVIGVAAGHGHSLAVQADGRVIAWGLDDQGQARVPAGLSNAIAVAAGTRHSLALRNDGTVVAWGTRRFGATTVPPGLANVVAIGAGNDHSLAVLGVGARRPFLTAPLFDRKAPFGASRSLYAAAVGTWPLTYEWRRDGTALADATNATLRLEGLDWSDTAVYSVRVTDALGSSTDASTRLEVLPLRIRTTPQDQRSFVGGTASFWVEVEGEEPFQYQWQHNGADLPNQTNAWLELASVQFPDGGDYAVVVANVHGTQRSPEAGLLVSPLVAWGENRGGECDAPPDLTNVVALAGGFAHSLALKGDGTLVAWGTNDFGQATIPAGLTNVVAIASGQVHNLALKADGTVAAWGRSTFGATTVPAGLSNVVAIAAGGEDSMALLADGTVAGWGMATNLPALPLPAIEIATAHRHGAALLTDGSVVSWGTFYGNGADLPITTPAGLSGVEALAAKYNHLLALRSDGTVASWGGGSTNVFAGETNLVAISGGWSHCLGLRADRTVTIWDSPTFGQTNVPPGLGGVAFVAAGSSHNLAWVGPPAAVPELMAPFWLNGEIQVAFRSVRGRRYQLEFSDVLHEPRWTALPRPPTPGNGSVIRLTDPAPVAGTRFYRVRMR